MKYPLQVAQIISFSAFDKQLKRITFQSKEEHEEFIRTMPSNVQLIEKDENGLPIFKGTWKAFDELVDEGDAIIAKRKEPVLQQHFEQLGLDLGVMNKPNED